MTVVSRYALLILATIAACRPAPPDAAHPSSPALSSGNCLPDNGGIELPDGFCAVVVADSLGRARQVAVDVDGDVYVRLADEAPDGSVVALRDSDGDGRADRRATFFTGDGGRGLGLRGGFLYVSTATEIFRYRLPASGFVPEGGPERIVGGFPEQNSHNAKTFAFDGEGGLYVNVGAPSNACQVEARTRESPGQDPCPQLERQGGIWRFDADRSEQTQEADGRRYATGIRNAVAIEWNPALRHLFVVQHGRDSLSDLWPQLFTAEQSSDLPAEEMLSVSEGDDFGWPYCYYDPVAERKVLAPEYGGDGRMAGRCESAGDPFAAFPGHWAPNDLVFYDATYFPEHYRRGAFIAFHGSWNRTPLQEGYRVVFLPMDENGAPGEYETFADGFARADTVSFASDAVFRPVGLATGPDGSLYILDSRKGRLWRVLTQATG